MLHFLSILVTVVAAFISDTASAASLQVKEHITVAQKVAPNQGSQQNQGTVTPPPTPHCPKGTVGKWPICIEINKPRCPKGTVGKWPRCYRRGPGPCPKGTVRAGKKCIKVERKRYCPKGTIGKWPDCYKPGGTYRSQGAPPPQKSGTQECAPGTVGQWPHCSKVGAPCPEGHVRKNKVCVALPGQTGGSSTTPPAAFSAPAAQDVPPEIAALTANRPHRPREILILVLAANADQIAARLARDYNVIADPGQTIALLDRSIVRLRLVDNRPLEQVLAALAEEPDIDLVQPNYVYEASKGPGAEVTVPQYSPDTLNLKDAHRLARGNRVKIAIIDTAIDETHPEIAGAVAETYAFDGEPPAPEGHGTAIAGILAAHSVLTGVAPGARLLSVPAFRSNKTALAESTSLELLKGIDWAFASGARLINMSFTGPKDPLLGRIIKEAAADGGIFVAAAGNGGPTAPPLYPAAYPEVIAVTATDQSDRLYANANRGEYIALAAPGVDIVVPGLSGSYELQTGTSMAAAHVAGVVALMLERNQSLDWRDAQSALLSTARTPPEGAAPKEFGAGIVNAADALNSL